MVFYAILSEFGPRRGRSRGRRAKFWQRRRSAAAFTRTWPRHSRHRLDAVAGSRTPLWWFRASLRPRRAQTPSHRAPAAATPSTRVVSRRGGRGWFLSGFWGRSDRDAPRRLRADDVDAARATAALFTREEAGEPEQHLRDMQASWYELAVGSALARRVTSGTPSELRELAGPALKLFLSVEKHFSDFVEDQFDFHTYCAVWKSTSVSGAAVLARSSGEEPASPRHRAGVASMAWRRTRTRRKFYFHTGIVSER